MVLMHLVQVDVVLARTEEALADGCERDAAVTEFPVLRGRGPDRPAEKTGEELVAEADSQEAEIGALDPECLEKLQQLQDPFVVPMSIIHTPRNEQPVKAVEILHGWDPSTLFGHDEDLVCLYTQRRMVGGSGLAKVIV